MAAVRGAQVWDEGSAEREEQDCKGLGKQRVMGCRSSAAVYLCHVTRWDLWSLDGASLVLLCFVYGMIRCQQCKYVLNKSLLLPVTALYCMLSQSNSGKQMKCTLCLRVGM